MGFKQDTIGSLLIQAEIDQVSNKLDDHIFGFKSKFTAGAYNWVVNILDCINIDCIVIASHDTIDHPKPEITI
jgi:hypothetical protein